MKISKYYTTSSDLLFRKSILQNYNPTKLDKERSLKLKFEYCNFCPNKIILLLNDYVDEAIETFLN